MPDNVAVASWPCAQKRYSPMTLKTKSPLEACDLLLSERNQGLRA